MSVLDCGLYTLPSAVHRTSYIGCLSGRVGALITPPACTLGPVVPGDVAVGLLTLCGFRLAWRDVTAAPGCVRAGAPAARASFGWRARAGADAGRG